MVEIDVSTADALDTLKTKLRVESIEEVFFRAGRKSCETYSRASALDAYLKFEAAGGQRLPDNVLVLCHDNQIFPVISI